MRAHTIGSLVTMRLAANICAGLAAAMLLPSAAWPAEALLVEGAWVRAMPPTQRMTAAYMTLKNAGSVPVVLRGARAPLAAHAGLHETRRDEDRVRMQAVDTLSIAPGESLELAPGGLHVMLMGLERMPATGDSLSVCLQTDAGEQCQELPVLREAPTVGEEGATTP